MSGMPIPLKITNLDKIALHKGDEGKKTKLRRAIRINLFLVAECDRFERMNSFTCLIRDRWYTAEFNDLVCNPRWLLQTRLQNLCV
jgi:hypothetical protein